jgi:hypothetical protein
MAGIGEAWAESLQKDQERQTKGTKKPSASASAAKPKGKGKGLANAITSYLKEHPMEMKAVLAAGGMGAMAGGAPGALAGLAAGALLARKPVANEGLTQMLAGGPGGPPDDGYELGPKRPADTSEDELGGPKRPAQQSAPATTAPAPAAAAAAPVMEERQSIWTPEERAAFKARHLERMKKAKAMYPESKEDSTAAGEAPRMESISPAEARHRFDQQTGSMQGQGLYERTGQSATQTLTEAQQQQEEATDPRLRRRPGAYQQPGFWSYK